MPQIGGFLDLMDSRSFSSLWFWLVVIAGWTLTGRAVLGVPSDVIARAGRDPAGPAGMTMLDWLSLTLPRWQVTGSAGPWLLAVAGFVLTGLALLGFGYGLEAAQAISLLLIPYAGLTLMRLRLAHRLTPLIARAQHGEIAPHDAATAALKAINLHRWAVLLLGMLAVAVVALWGSIWALRYAAAL